MLEPSPKGRSVRPRPSLLLPLFNGSAWQANPRLLFAKFDCRIAHNFSR
jgi:hypothetical protein